MIVDRSRQSESETERLAPITPLGRFPSGYRPDRQRRRLLPLLAVTASMLLVLDLLGFGPIVSVRKAAVALGQPIGSLFGVVVGPVSGAWHGAVHYDDVVDENAELRRQLAELEGELAGQGDIEAELRQVLVAIEVDYVGDVQRVAARVVADRSTDLERIVEIDKGAEHGVTPGLPVVTGRGLVGVTELVSDSRSTLRLVSDIDSAVGVRSDQGLGLAVGGRGNVLALEPTEELAAAVLAGEAAPGRRFVTSGVAGSAFPAGIPVGTLIGDEMALAPLADLANLAYVTVLLVEPQP